ncbi:helix-turn-helix domain-containing protein [Nocardia aurea]|uniref:Helix-turn-helix domain-containing protein n=1 Tax=Nocardia aurea TaxID=2144174 RepID=A0ABV3G1B9_9NOCA
MQEPARLCNAQEAADRLRISRSQLYALIRSGELKSVKIGARRLFSDSHIRDFIDQLSDSAA